MKNEQTGELLDFSYYEWMWLKHQHALCKRRNESEKTRFLKISECLRISKTANEFYEKTKGEMPTEFLPPFLVDANPDFLHQYG